MSASSYTPEDRAAATAIVDAAHPNASAEWKRLNRDHYIGLEMPFARFQREERELKAGKQAAVIVAQIAVLVTDICKQSERFRVLGATGRKAA